VDETGGQVAVFGRIGSRPLNAEERAKFYLRDGKPVTVKDDASGYEERRAAPK